MKNLFFPVVVFCAFFVLNHQSIAEDTKGDKKVETSDVEKNDPVVLKGITNYHRVKWEQQEYIRKYYENYHIVMKLVYLPKDKDGSFIQSFILEDDGGKKVRVDFDATDAYKARSKKDNKELEDLVKDMEKNRKSLTSEERKKLNAISKLANEIALEEVKKLGKKPEELTREEWEKIDKIVQEAIKKEQDKGSNSSK